MAIYKITNVAANKCLNIYGESVTSLSNNQNVTLGIRLPPVRHIISPRSNL